MFKSSQIKKIIEVISKRYAINLLIISVIISLMEFLSIFSIYPVFYYLENKVLIETELYQSIVLFIMKYVSLTVFQVVILISSLVLVMTNLMIFLRNLSKSKIKERIVSRNRSYVLSLISETSINNFKKIDNNIVQSYLSVEGERVAQIVLSFTNLLSALLVIILISMYLVFLDYYLLIFIVFVIILLIILLKNSYKKSKIYGRELSQANSNYIKYIQNIINEKVFFMLSSPEIISKGLSVGVVKKLHSFQYELQKRTAYIEFVIKTATMLSILLVVYIFYIKEFELSLILFIGILFVRLIPFLNQFGNALQNLKSNMPLIDKLIQIEKTMEKVNSIDLNNIDMKEVSVDSRFLSCSFSDPNLKKITLRSSNVYGLYGGSGAGKTSLAESILGLNVFRDAKILLNNDITISSGLYQTVLKNSLYMSQHIIPSEFTIEELFQDIDIEKVTLFLRQIKIDISNIKTLYARKLSSFSGGEQQRFSFVYALMSKKKILIFDEPTSASHKEITLIMLEMAYEYAKNNKAIVIIISHDPLIKNNIDAYIEIKNK